jgi:hypothetical protein
MVCASFFYRKEEVIRMFDFKGVKKGDFVAEEAEAKTSA